MEKQNEIISILEKLRDVFNLLGFSQAKKEKLFAELLDGVFRLAIAKTIKGNPDFAKKLKGINPQELSAEKIGHLSNILDPSTESFFVKELRNLLTEYINQVSQTVDANKKRRIQQIWYSKDKN